MFKRCSKGVKELQRNCQCKTIPGLLNWKGSLGKASMKILHFQEIQSGVLISSFKGLRDQETRPLRQKLTTSLCLRLPPNPKYLNLTLKTSSTPAQSIIDNPWSIQTQSSLRNTVKSTHYIFCRALEFPSNFISIPASFLPTALPFISPHVRSCHSQALICLSPGWIICSSVVQTGLRCHAGLPRCAWVLAESHARADEKEPSQQEIWALCIQGLKSKTERSTTHMQAWGISINYSLSQANLIICITVTFTYHWNVQKHMQEMPPHIHFSFADSLI